MEARARKLLQLLDLQRHPEGGWYREIFRSPREVHVPAQAGATRSAVTTIYFLLMQNEPTAWHSVASDEIWHFLEGAPAELLVADPERSLKQTHRLGPLGGDSAVPVAIVAAGHWQMARTLGGFTLVGCTVGPGFDFADFKLLPGGGEPHL